MGSTPIPGARVRLESLFTLDNSLTPTILIKNNLSLTRRKGSTPTCHVNLVGMAILFSDDTQVQLIYAIRRGKERKLYLKAGTSNAGNKVVEFNQWCNIQCPNQQIVKPSAADTYDTIIMRRKIWV